MLPGLWSYGQDAVTLADAYMARHYKDFGLHADDWQGRVLLDQYRSGQTQVSHLYFAQQYQGIGVSQVQAAIHIDAQGEVVAAHCGFVPDLAAQAAGQRPLLGAAQAVQRSLDLLKLKSDQPLRQLRETSGPSQETTFEGGHVSQDPIHAQLVWVVADARVHLAWAVRLYPHRGDHWWTTRIDATTGTLLGLEDWVTHDTWADPDCDAAHSHALPPQPAPAALLSGASYRVLPLPVESPAHGTRALLGDPADALASPYGWHDVNGSAGADYYTTRGNNADTYLDAGNNNNPVNGDADRADGGAGLVFDFAFDPTQPPATNRDAALSQLFYTVNRTHDILYHYGFDEAAGNFQQNNYGRGGQGNDYLRAEAQDGGGTNNANFATPPDGIKPRMQMYLWNHTTPARDGSLDNAVIIHEYAHGLSNRLTGGPSSVYCLTNGEQMGEGWSDWLALMLTMQSGDQGSDARGVANYLLGENPGDPGLRTSPYSTDFSIDAFTYADLPTVSHPYGTGHGWATILWELTWALIDTYGFDADLVAGSGGNNMALQLVIDGMTLQPCQPGFADARDAILLADQLRYAGANQCLLWEAFARRGLGYSASQGNSQSRTDGTAAFDLPPACRQELQLTLHTSPDSHVVAGSDIQVMLSIRNQKTTPLTQVVVSSALPAALAFVPGSASHGGSAAGAVVQFPPIDLAAGEQAERSFSVIVDTSDYTSLHFADDQEQEKGNWSIGQGSGTADWSKTSVLAYDGTQSWFAADVNALSDQYLVSRAIELPAQPLLRFWHNYNTESGSTTAYDGGVLELSTDGGLNWQDLGSRMTLNGYTRTVSSSYGSPLSGRMSFAGNSGGFVRTEVDLSDFAGQQVRLRFRFATDYSVGHIGWYVDRVEVLHVVTLRLSACAVASEGDSSCDTLAAPGLLVDAPVSFPVEWLDFEVTPRGGVAQLRWRTARETQNAGFEVQRSAGDGRFFENIGWVPGQGDTSEVRLYSYADTSVRPGVYYTYRLRQVDLDGAAHFSPTRVLHMPRNTQLACHLYPNPARQEATLAFTAYDTDPIDLVIADALGRAIHRQTIRALGAEGLVPLDLQGWQPGLYWVSVRQDTHIQTLCLRVE
ncbi:MAG: hypothetical protein OHK0039_12930 [Bacteroidia bacterium]